MSKLFSVIKREYGQIVRKKSFAIWTIITPFYLTGIMVIPGLLAVKSATPTGSKKITVVDLTGFLFADYKSMLKDTLPNGQLVYLLDEVPATTETLSQIEPKLRKRVLKGNLDGYLIIPANILDSNQAIYHSKTGGQLLMVRFLEQALSQTVIACRAKRAGLEPAQVTNLSKRINLSTVRVTKTGRQKSDFLTGFFLAMSLVLILFGAIQTFGQHLMRSIIEEKNSRIIEVLLSSLTSFQLMAGKILGLGLAGLTQLVIWFGLGIGLTLGVGTTNPTFQQVLSTLSANIILLFVAFFILGYFLYSMIFAFVGAVCNSEQESQYFQFPIIMSLIFPVIVGFAISQDPNRTWVTILSLFPLFTPTLMVMRASFMQPPPIQVALSLVLLFLSVIAMGWFTARIFRVGILMYGKRPTLSEIMRWLRYQ